MATFQMTLEFILVGSTNRNIIRIYTELSSFGMFRKRVMWIVLWIMIMICHLDDFAQRARVICCL